MSWVDQCRLVFKVRADGMLWSGKVSRFGILSELSKQSGIPIKILRAWWGPNGRPKRVHKGDSCLKCNKRPVILTQFDKPYSPESKIYGLCFTCRTRFYRRKEENKP